MEEEERPKQSDAEEIELISVKGERVKPIHRRKTKPVSKCEIFALLVLSCMFIAILIALWNMPSVKPTERKPSSVPIRQGPTYNYVEKIPEFSGDTITIQNSARKPVSYTAARKVNTFTVQIPRFEIKQMTEVCFGPFFMDCPPSGCAILGYKARPSKYVHHMILQAMHGNVKKEEPHLMRYPGCKSGDYDYAFAWADHEGKENQFALDLPEIFEYRVGKDKASAQYFILDVHFSGDPIGFDSETAIEINWVDKALTHRRPSHSTILLIAPLSIPAQQKAYTICSEKKLVSESDLIWFGQRVHAHHSGRRIQTHVYRDGVYIGATGESSKIPQVFRNLDTPRLLRPGDVLQVTCTYNTEDKNFVTTMGLDKFKQEMCNHYFLYGPVNKEVPTHPIMANWQARSCRFKEKETNSFQLNRNFQVRFPIGTPTAISEDSNGFLWVFHRGEFVWQDRPGNERPIKSPCILQVDPNTGAVLKKFGTDFFLIPHGLYVDTEDTIWVTDVGRHQVFQFDMEGKLLMTLGKERMPGLGATQFNKPTDVVRDLGGRIYVSDGYGNSRVAVFDNKGTFIRDWGSSGRGPGQFHVPHSIAMDNFGRVYVADRENSRMQVWESLDQEPLVWKSTTGQRSRNPWTSHLSAVHFSHHLELLLAIDGPAVRMLDRDGNDVAEPFGMSEAEWPHDVIATRRQTAQGVITTIYVVHLSGKKVLAYDREVSSDELNRHFRRDNWG